jgi:hypothetical protein
MAALDDPKRSKSLCMRYSFAWVWTSQHLACRRTAGRENRSARRRTSPGIPSPNRVWRCIFSFEFQPVAVDVAVWDVRVSCHMCADIMCGERTSGDSYTYARASTKRYLSRGRARAVPSRGMVARPRVVETHGFGCETIVLRLRLCETM